MNGRNGIMMPLGALVTAFLTVLIVGTVTNVAHGAFSQSTTVVLPTSTPPPVPTTTPAPLVTTSAPAEDPQVNGSVTAGGDPDKVQVPPSNPAQVSAANPPAVGYPLHLVGKSTDLETLLAGGLTVTWTAAGITSQTMSADGRDNLVLSTPGPVTKICLAATPPARAGHWVYLAGTTKFQPTADGACFNGEFPADGLTITVTKE